ncbi:MAG TPA: hypothetical protein VFJ81_14390 [Gemmatimonadales bacterium]|jgi:hypothetical protein|nr:hypothetical protein [Gemmatimonadales bacterium]
MRHRRSLLLFLASSLTVAALGCSDNSGPSNPRPPAATYTMTSFQNPPNPVLTPPTATGTLVLAATTYNVTINVQGQDPVTDQGTYTISGNNWSQTSTTNQGVQSTGTYTYNESTGVLTVDVTAFGVRTISAWQKQ